MPKIKNKSNSNVCQKLYNFQVLGNPNNIRIYTNLVSLFVF